MAVLEFVFHFDHRDDVIPFETDFRNGVKCFLIQNDTKMSGGAYTFGFML